MRLKWLLPLVLMGTALGQSTSVTLQVTDADGQTWNNGTWQVQLVSQPASTNQGPPFFIVGGVSNVPNQIQSGSLGATGQASLTLTPNASIAPALTNWQFTVCPKATSPCFSPQNVVIAGATQTVTITPPAIRIGASFPQQAYTNTEIVSSALGSFYFNLVDGTFHFSGVTLTNPLNVNGNPVQNANLTSASNGNTVTLLNVQGGVGAITGTAADATMYTYTLPANTVVAGKVLRITYSYNHTTGSAGVTYKIKINGVTVLASVGLTDSTTQATPNQSFTTNIIFADTSTTAQAMGHIEKADGSGLGFGGTYTGLSWTTSQTVLVTFNVANTDAVTPRMFLVELVQ